MSATLKQTFEAALRGRGERLISTGALDQWTRQYMGLRDANDRLIPAPTPRGPSYWYLGNAGALRIGTKRSTTMVTDVRVRNALLAEGIKALEENKRKK